MIPAVERLGRRRPVVHTATFELLHTLGWQPLPSQPWCEDQRLARDLTRAAIRAGHAQVLERRVEPDTAHVERRHDFYFESPCLRQRAARQVRARDARRESKVVLDAAGIASLASRPIAVEQNRGQPFGGRVDGRRESRRTGAHDGHVVHRALGLDAQTDLQGEVAHGGRLQAFPSGNNDEREFDPLCERARFVTALVGRLDVEELVRDVIVREELFDLMDRRRETTSDHLDAAVARPVLRAPVVEEFFDDGVQMLLGWIPGLLQVIVDLRAVDGGDGRLRVGVRRQQRTPGIRKQLPGLREKADAIETGHPLIREQQRYRLGGLLELAQRDERFGRIRSADDSVVFPETSPQVAGNGRHHLRVVVDSENDGTSHEGQRIIIPSASRVVPTRSRGMPLPVARYWAVTPACRAIQPGRRLDPLEHAIQLLKISPAADEHAADGAAAATWVARRRRCSP